MIRGKDHFGETDLCRPEYNPPRSSSPFPVTFPALILFSSPVCVHPRLSAGTYHGMYHVEESAIREMIEWTPDVIVMLQGANDAARDTKAMFEMRLRRWFGHLQGNITEGKLAPPKKFIYVTCPTRIYKCAPLRPEHRVSPQL